MWVFLEATWDITNGLELWLQRKKVGRFQHSFGSEVSTTVKPQPTESVLVLGANVEFQLDDFQLRTASRRLLTRMERMTHGEAWENCSSTGIARVGDQRTGANVNFLKEKIHFNKDTSGVAELEDIRPLSRTKYMCTHRTR